MNRILVGLLLIFIICCSGICLGSEKQDSEPEQRQIQDQTENTKRVTKEVGPFEIGKKRISVILDITEYSEHAYVYNSFEIKDETGESHYKELIESTPESSTSIEGIFKLEGKSGEGLIFYFNTSPSAPLGGKSFQIFGAEKGKVKPLSTPLSLYGSIVQLSKGKSKEVLKLINGDLITIEVWKDCFGVVIPLVVDLKKMTIAPLRTEGMFDINIGYTPEQPHAVFGIPVKFYADHNINAKEEKIDAANLKKVEFLNAYADVQFKKNKWRDIDVSNLWLKVKINGREGWVNGLEDFFTLGLIPSG